VVFAGTHISVFFDELQQLIVGPSSAKHKIRIWAAFPSSNLSSRSRFKAGWSFFFMAAEIASRTARAGSLAA
jgi:hypothetical protein